MSDTEPVPVKKTFIFLIFFILIAATLYMGSGGTIPAYTAQDTDKVNQSYIEAQNKVLVEQLQYFYYSNKTCLNTGNGSEAGCYDP